MASRCSTRWTRTTMLEVNALIGFGADDAGDGPHLHWRVLVNAVAAAGTRVLIGDLDMRATPGGADQCNGGTPYASSSWSSFTSDRGFNNNTTNDGWISNYGDYVGSWLAYQFAAPVFVQEVVWYGTVLFGTTTMTAFTLQFSDDGVAWTDRHSWTGTSPGSPSVWTI